LSILRKKNVLSWALYDWANSAFSTTVMAGFFPVFFKQYWADGMDAAESTFLLGNANALASLLVVLMAPLLGAIADHGGVRKRFLILFAFMGIVMTGGLYLAAQGNWMMAILLYVVAVVGFSGGNIFYDSLLVDVSPVEKRDLVSAAGYAFGYLGGGILFTVNVVMTLHPEYFGLADPAEAVRLAFLSVALWWALFSLPVMLFVKEPGVQTKSTWVATVKGGFSRLVTTFRQLRTLRQTFLFLLAYWLYIDGVDTIVRMAVDYGLALGFEASGLMLALLITQFVGFPAALLFGYLGERRGPRQGIMIAIFVYLLVIAWAYQMESEWEFYLLAGAIGLVQGGIQSLSRSIYSTMIPRDQAGEFFGFYNMLGKFAAVIGPFLMGWVSVATGEPRYSIVAISILFIAGAIILARVDIREGQRQAEALVNRGS
jgi:UMF1 family MFS transporter